MFELFEKALFAGIGTLSLTRQKSEELIGEFQRQFNLSEEKGKELFAKTAGSRPGESAETGRTGPGRGAKILRSHGRRHLGGIRSTAPAGTASRTTLLHEETATTPVVGTDT